MSWRAVYEEGYEAIDGTSVMLETKALRLNPGFTRDQVLDSLCGLSESNVEVVDVKTRRQTLDVRADARFSALGAIRIWRQIRIIDY